ncbi:MAG: formate dehydrogenase [Beijerinckiaceae bacterium]|nr:formate dehydrogenase [Beijerinckiaceae bacterium]
MSNEQDKKALDRRSFFRGLGGVAAVAGAATATGVDPAVAQQPRTERTKARYRESEHVKAFYRTNRY